MSGCASRLRALIGLHATHHRESGPARPSRGRDRPRAVAGSGMGLLGDARGSRRGRCRSPRPARRRSRRAAPAARRRRSIRRRPRRSAPPAGGSRTAATWPGLALGEGLADAEDRRRRARRRTRSSLARDRASVSPNDCAALAVADEDVAAAEVVEHREGDLAGEGAGGRSRGHSARRARRPSRRAPRPRRSSAGKAGAMATSRRAASRAREAAELGRAARRTRPPRSRCGSSSSCRRRAGRGSSTPFRSIPSRRFRSVGRFGRAPRTRERQALDELERGAAAGRE